MMHPEELLEEARKVAEKAYAPYSKYPVGAALLTKGGDVYVGCNIENASYGLTICAERVAIFKAVADGRRDFTAIAIVGGEREIAYPCGACRQVMAEFCGFDFEVHCSTLRGDKSESYTLGALLPHGFAAGTF